MLCDCFLWSRQCSIFVSKGGYMVSCKRLAVCSMKIDGVFHNVCEFHRAKYASNNEDSSSDTTDS